MRDLDTRLTRLEHETGAQYPVWIVMQDGETTEKAQARWLREHTDRKAEIERHEVRFIRHVIV